MANASTAAATVVNTAMVVTGSVSGTIVAGMTVTGANVPAGVTVVSQSLGPTGGTGTYVVTASSANVSVAEPLTFGLYQILQTIGNAFMPQNPQDFAWAAGFALVVAMCPIGPSATQSAEYTFGTHQQAIYNAENVKSQIFPSVRALAGATSAAEYTFGTNAQAIYNQPQPQVFKAVTTTTEVKRPLLQTLIAGPQSYDPTSTQQPFLDAPQTAETFGIFGAEFTFGTNATAIYNSQVGSKIFAAVFKTPAIANAPRTVLVAPQELARDLTLQPWLTNITLNQGWVNTFAGASPQGYDWTLQATLTPASPFLVTPLASPPKPHLFGTSQSDPTQMQPVVFHPPPAAPKYAPIAQVFATPTPADYRQPMGQVYAPRNIQPSHYVQPAVCVALEQRYDNIYPIPFAAAAQLGGTPVPPGFWVQAVTAGWYGGRFRTPGDIFLLAKSADFSDSTIDYQPGSSNTVGYGWMARTAATMAYDWLQSNNSPYLPPQDPNRRFIY